MNSNYIHNKLYKLSFTMCALIVSISSHAIAIYDTGTLNFKSEDQSIWGTGSGFTKSESVFLGSEWYDQTAMIGGIVGSENTVVIPAIGALTVPIFEPKIWIPTPTWTNPLKGYYTGCGCVKDVQITPAIDAVTADTRTGVQLDVTSSGKVGLEFGYSIDSGTIDTFADFSAMANIPDSIAAAEFISLNTSDSFDEGSIATQSPKVEAYVDTVLNFSGEISAKACALTFSCVENTLALPEFGIQQNIVSVDLNSLKILDGIMPDDKPFAEIPLLNQSLSLAGAVAPYVGFELTGPGGLTLASSIPPGPSVSIDLAEFEVQVPDITTEGIGSGDNVTSSGRDDLLSMQVDIDGVAALLSGSIMGVSETLINSDKFKVNLSLDLIDVDAGPVVGITQDFEMIPTLMTRVDFSNPVEIDGLLESQYYWTGLWQDLPDLAIFEDTVVTPTFWVEALLRNEMGIDLGLVGTLDILKLGATASVDGFDVLNFTEFSLNNLLGMDNTLFETDKIDFSVYNDQFNLEGFNTITGDSFLLAITQVPEPSTWGLILIGLLMIFVHRKVQCQKYNNHREIYRF